MTVGASSIVAWQKKNKKILQTVNVVLLRIETVTVSRQLEVMICESQHLR